MMGGAGWGAECLSSGVVLRPPLAAATSWASVREMAAPRPRKHVRIKDSVGRGTCVHARQSQRATCMVRSPSTMWLLETELRAAGRAAGSFIHSACCSGEP